jgi:predicted component of type VI protein secretion system
MTACRADFEQQLAALSLRLAAAEEQAAAAGGESETLRVRVATLETAAESDRRTIADLEAEVSKKAHSVLHIIVCMWCGVKQPF